MMELYQAPGSGNKLFPRSEILRKIFVELKFVVRKVTNVRVLWEEEVEGMDKECSHKENKEQHSIKHSKWREFFTHHKAHQP